MNRNLINTLIIIIILSLIGIVNADPPPCMGISQFDNCGLETGDFTGWTVPLILPPEIYVDTSAAYYQIYGAGVNPVEIYNGDGYTYDIQSFSTSHVNLEDHGNITNLSFWYKVDTSQVSGNGMNELRIYVPVGGEGILKLKDDVNPSETGWTLYEISGEDLYALLESEQPGWGFGSPFYITFEGSTYKPEAGAGTASLEVFVDEVTITFNDGPTPTPTSTFQDKINSKLNDIQTMIFGGIMLVVIASLIVLVSTIIFGSKE